MSERSDLMTERPIIAIATGDVAGIGPEISMKAALDPAVRNICRPIVVCDPAIIRRHAQACRIEADIGAVEHVAQAEWSAYRLNVLSCPTPEAAGVDFGTNSAASGRAALA